MARSAQKKMVVAACCSVLRYVAVYCSVFLRVMQCVVCQRSNSVRKRVLQKMPLQCVSAWCSVLYYVAVCSVRDAIQCE